MLARTEYDLKKKRRNSEIWTKESWGQLGRAPDVLAPYIISLYKSRERLSSISHPKCDFGHNVVNYHRYCMENDLYVAGLLAGGSSQFAIASGIGAQVAGEILSTWACKRTHVHDVLTPDNSS